MINFADIMTRIYTQIAEVKNINLLPYYMFVSQDVYSELQKETTLRKEEDKDIPAFAYKIEFFEGLEVVVFHNSDLNDYILVKGIKVAVA